MTTLIESWVSKQTKRVQSNLKMDFNPGTALHVSPDFNLKTLTPRVPKRHIIGEDLTVNRVSTADTLIDCMRGYAAVLIDFIRTSYNASSKSKYRGVYRVYAVPYSLSVLPTKTICPMVTYIQERWLVDYESGVSYTPTEVGSFFVESMEKGNATLLLSVFSPYRLNHDTVLKTGYYRLIVNYVGSETLPRLIGSRIRLTTINKTEFNQSELNPFPFLVEGKSTFEDWSN